MQRFDVDAVEKKAEEVPEKTGTRTDSEREEGHTGEGMKVDLNA